MITAILGATAWYQQSPSDITSRVMHASRASNFVPFRMPGFASGILDGTSCSDASHAVANNSFKVGIASRASASVRDVTAVMASALR